MLFRFLFTKLLTLCFRGLLKRTKRLSKHVLGVVFPFYLFNKPFFRKYHLLNTLCLEQWDCPDSQEIQQMYRCVI